MLFMIIRKGDAITESGLLPGPEAIEAMGRYREELAASGVYRGGDGLLSTAHGAKLLHRNGKSIVTDGPFAEAKEVIAGFVLVEVGSLAEAVSWARLCPSLAIGDAELEIRQVAEAAHFPAEARPGLARMPWSTVAAQAEATMPSLSPPPAPQVVPPSPATRARDAGRQPAVAASGDKA